MTLDLDGDGLLGLTVDSSALGALTQNSGTIRAAGGAVYLSAAAADALAGTVVNNSGVIQARSVDEVNGKIVLNGGINGTVTNSGTLNAAGTDSGETGGTVKMLGETVELAAGGQIDSSGASGGGTVVLSATDNIAVTGIITNTGGSGTIKLRADSDADTSGTVAFGGGKLVTTDGTVEIYYNPSGTTTTTINGVATTVKDYTHPTDYSGNINLSGEGALTSYMLVNNVNELQAVNLNLGGNYALGGDIDAGSTAIWNPDGSGGYSGFTPLGAFTGVFDGGGHTIRNLYINRPATNYVGLFRYCRGAISNLGLKDGNIAGKIDVGGLVGANFGTISDSYNTGEVRGTRFYVGGLAGYNSGDILRSYNTGNVSSNQGQVGGLIGMNYGNLVDSHNIGIVSSQVDINSNRVGGLVGNNYGHITTSYNTGSVSASSWGAGGIAGENDGSIINSYNSGAITGGVPSCGEVGGLAGLNDGGLITNSYNTGVVNSTKYVGGLVGNSDNGGGIIGSFNTGVVSGSESSVGGLVGYNGDADSGDYILNSYNTGSVSGESNVGGLVGWNWGSITNSYNTGLVSGSISSSTGGLVGYYQETIITIVNSYWDIKTSGTARGVGIDRSFDHLGRTTAEMTTQSNYPQADGEWDFTNVWGMIDGVSYPYLKCFYQDTPQVISGTVSSGGGQTVQTVLNGTALSSVATGANGFYYMLFTNGTIADHDALLAYVDNGDGNGNAVYGVSGVNASITGLDITADTVSVDSDTPSLALTNLLTAAKGSFADDDILYNSTNALAVITGNLTVNGACGISGDITASGNQTYTGTVTLNGNRTLTSGDTVTFGSTVIGDNHMLTVAEYNSSGGNAVFHGNVTGLAALQVDGAGSISGNIITSGDQTYTGAVTLNGDRTLTSGDTVTFGNTVSGDNHRLTVAEYNSSGGNAVFRGNVTGLSALQVDGTGGIGGDITTSGDQTYTGAVTLNGDRTLSSGGTVSFGSTATGDTHRLSVAQYNSLGGNAVFHGDVTGLSALQVDGTGGIGGDITTSGDQTYTGAVTLNGNRTLTSGDTVTFGNTVSGDNHRLTVAEYNSLGGNAVFHGDVTGLSALQVDGAGSIGGDITTNGNQIYTGAVNLTEDSILSGSTVTFEDTVDGNFALRIAGNAEFGGNADVASVNVSGTATLDGDIITTSDQTYTGAIMLNGSRTLSADGSITFAGSVTASGAVEIRGADGISINQALNANGDAVNLITDGGEIRQSETGVITAASLALDTEDSDNGTYGAIYLDRAENQITTLSGTTGNLFLQDRCDLTLGAITAAGDLRVSVPNATLIVNGAVSAAAAIMITAQNGLTIGGSGSVTASDGNLTLATVGGHFINNNTASDAVGAPSGRWLIYSIGLTGDQRGNLDYNFSQYNTSYGGGVLGTGNGFIYAANLTLTAGLTGPVTKTYDGTATAEVTAAEVTVNSNLTNAQYSVNIEDGSYYADQDAGAGKSVTTGTVTVTGVTDSHHKTVYGYSYTPVNLTADVGVINKAALSVTANDAIWYFGRTEPIYDATYSGWAGDDTAAILGTLNYTTTYDGAMGGEYAIKVSGPAATTNYTVSYYDGVLTVTSVFNSKYVGALADLINSMDRVNTDWGEADDSFNLQIMGQGINLDGVNDGRF